MTRHLIAILLLAGCAAPNPPPASTAAAAPGAQSSGTQVWKGRMRCDPIPGMTSLTLVQPVDITVVDGQASYQRIVRRGDMGGDSENVERGGGPVAADGTVTLTGSVTSPRYSYTATYEGRLPPNGRTGGLAGVQHWRARSISSFDRPCSWSLQR